MGWVFNTPDDTPTYGLTLVSIGMVMTGLALVTVLLRLYVRLVMIKATGWDDWVIIVAWLGAAGYTIAMTIRELPLAEATCSGG